LFQLLDPITATLKSVTPRTECHGEDTVVAISMRMTIEGPNTLLDALSPKLRHALYMAAPDQEQLPGLEATPLLRFDAFEHHALKACFEGWTLKVDHGIEEDDPITLGGAKVDAFRIDAKQGGTVALSFRVGSNDVSAGGDRSPVRQARQRDQHHAARAREEARRNRREQLGNGPAAHRRGSVRGRRWPRRGRRWPGPW
jgi:hypothetical protein